MALNVVILAAGKGTRMKSDLPKVLHKVAERPMVQHVIDTARALGADKPQLVYGYGAQALTAAMGDQALHWVLQAEQLGIRRIEANNKGGLVEFSDKTAVSPAYIIELIQKQSRVFKLEGGQKLRFSIASNDGAERLSLIANMLSDFARHKVEK